MALNSHAFIIVAVLSAVTMFSTTSTAEEFIVGDDYNGWTVGFDYQTWTANKIFHVGDKIVFKYPVGEHNVYSVNGVEFKNCSFPSGVRPMSSGHDVVELDGPGRRWYLCGVGNHCLNGQKVFINVLPTSQSPSPAPLSSRVFPILFPWAPSLPPAPWSSSKPAHAHHNAHTSTTPFGWLPRKLFRKFQHY